MTDIQLIGSYLPTAGLQHDVSKLLKRNNMKSLLLLLLLLFACGNEQTLGHVARGCNRHLREGRFNWRHDSILVNLANSLKVYSDVQLYVDNYNFRSPSIITGDDQGPDLLLIEKRNNMYVLELTVGFEPNIEKNAKRKNDKKCNFYKPKHGLPRYNWERLY